MTPNPAEWLFRPVISAARVGELRAVEKDAVVCSGPPWRYGPFVGVGIHPPKVLGTPKPAIVGDDQ